MKRILNLGWGVQSFTLAAMSALGDLEPLDLAIHADTTHEKTSTYEFAAKWTPWLLDHGVKVVTVQNKIRTNPINNGHGWPDEPFFSQDQKKHTKGKINRQCTALWKITPIRQQISLKLKEWGERKSVGIVEQWIGISLDEFQRMKDSDVKYIIHRWPLIEKRMTRDDCKEWLIKHDLEIPNKSSCVFCPFHDKNTWIEMKNSSDKDWKKAVYVDESIRDIRLDHGYKLFVHNSLKPLSDIDLTPNSEKIKDINSNWNEECSGMCGV